MNFFSLNIADLKNHFKSDFLSGFLIFLIALPLSLGIAMASGFPAMAGIIAACVGGIIVALFTGSYLTICGPAAGLIVVIINALDTLGKGNAEQGYRLTLAAIFFAGILQIIFGLFRSGKLSSFFPSAAVHGMMAAIGLIIIIKQFFPLLGAKAQGKEIMEVIIELPNAFLHMNPQIAMIGIISLLMLIFIPRINHPLVKKLPVPMLVVLVGIGFDRILHLSEVQEYHVWDQAFEIGPKYLVALPKDVFNGIVNPDFSAIATYEFWIVTLTIALVAALESILSITAIQTIDPLKRKVNFDKDLMALGLGTAISGFLGGLPMIAEIVRSSSNVNNKAISPWSNFFHGAILLFFVLVFPNLLQEIPLASLAAILVMVGWRLANPKEFKHMYQIGFDQFLVFVVTIFFTLKIDLLVGVAAGVATEILVNLIRGLTIGEFFSSNIKVLNLKEHNQPIIVVMKKGATFWNLFKLKQKLYSLPLNRDIVIDFTRVKLIDHSLMEFIEAFELECVERKVKFTKLGMDSFHSYTDYHSSARTRM